MRSPLDLFQLLALGLFLGTLGARVAVLWMRGVRVITLARGKPAAQALLEGALAVALPVWVWEVVAYAWPLPLHVFPPPFDTVLLEGTAVRAFGVAAIAAALGIFASSLVAFGDAWRVGIDREAPGALVTQGVFACSRNPIFVAMDLYVVGTFLVSGRLVFLLCALATLAALHAQILQEERFLEATFGAAYRQYRRRVPRYLGPRMPSAITRPKESPCD